MINLAYGPYSKYLTVSNLHTNPAQHYKDSLQNIVDDRFDIASDYEVIDLLDRDTLAKTSIGVRLAKIKKLNIEASVGDDYFKVLFKNFDTDIALGDLFEFSNYRWLVTDISKQGAEILSCMIQRCNVKLKFVRSNDDVMPTVNNTIISIDCIAEKKTYDVERDKYYTFPNEEIRVKLPNNSNSRKVRFDTKRGTRFLMGNPVQSYNTKSIDSISMVRTDLIDSNTDNGIILLKLQIDGFNNRTDNITSMVAKQYCYGDVEIEYILFVPDGSDSLIASDGKIFKVKEVV